MRSLVAFVCFVILIVGQFVHASTEAYVGEIKLFAGDFAPTRWALCDGQLLSIQQNTALFSILGTTYGGDGKTTFALPDLRGRIPMHFGQGQGLSQRVLGEMGGSEFITLLTSEMPAHTHAVHASTSATATQNSPSNLNFWGAPSSLRAYSPGPADTTMNGGAVGVTGGSQPHNNMPPYITVTYIICLAGVFPARS